MTLDNESDEFSRDVVIVSVVPEAGADEGALMQTISDRVKAATEVTPDRVVFERDEAAFVTRLFAKSRVKAEYVVEQRVSRRSAGEPR